MGLYQLLMVFNKNDIDNNGLTINEDYELKEGMGEHRTSP
jgi:hypothetical protein